MTGNLIIISSPSGGGKGTLIKAVLKTLPKVGYSVSYTTRAMRGGETQGKDYFFVSPAEFETLIKQGEFLEYATVHDNFYGTSLNQVKKEIEAGHDIILEIDVQGAASVRTKIPEAVSVFILPPSFEVLAARLTARATEKKEELALRLKNSFGEVNRFSEFEYVVVNDAVEKATAHLQTIILAERLKRVRQSRVIQGILDSFDESKNQVNGE
ncbi:MAG: guanylate kinase [Acidobacteria bacterium]|nr:guanylate kinase [Acidobacteriota bacterium]MBA3784546.1 guanylate kinase [Acidobacteriota bacterium]MBA4122361.1 guanylate kinase [Acidobacteriota bacterium]